MKRTRIAAHGLVLLCAGLSLTSCSGLRPRLSLAEPTIVRVPGPVQYVPVPPEYTAATPHASAPAPLCVDAEGVPVLCNQQLEAWKGAEAAQLDECNADKAAIAVLPPPKEGR